MGEVIWVEVLSRHREVLARHRCAGDELRIGRAYDNDVVLDDPHTAPHHLRVRRDEGGRLIADDLGSANGLYLDRGRRRTQRAFLDGETLLRIGHTYLRIRQTDHAVAPERTVPRSARRRLAMLGLAVAILGLKAGSIWLGETVEPVPSRYLVPLLGLVAIGALWTGLWSMLSRILTNHARFERNLLIALGGLFAYTFYAQFGQLVAFALSWPWLTAYAYVAIWSVAAAVCFFSWRVLAPARSWRKAAVILPLLAAAVTAETVIEREGGAGTGQQAYLQFLMPPAFHLAPLHSENAFFADVRQLQGEIDRDRAKEPAEAAAPTEIRPTSE